MSQRTLEIAALLVVIVCGVGCLAALARITWIDHRDAQFTRHVEDAERVLRSDEPDAQMGNGGLL